MGDFKEYLDKFRECKRLLEEEAKNDPITEPYRSKYKAKTLMLEIREYVNERLKNSDDDKDRHLYQASLASVLSLLAGTCTEIEEPTKAEEYLKETLACVPEPLHPDFIIVSLQTRNQLGFLYSQRTRPAEAKKWLEEGEKLYLEFKSFPDRVAKECVFLGEESGEGEKALEKTHTLTLFYLAQVYGMMKDRLKSAVYCHRTLKRELAQQPADPIDWALNAATLSQYFMERALLKQARHHLAAASYMLDKYEGILKTEEASQEMIVRREELRHRSADVSRCWVKYGIFLLEHSKRRLSILADTREEENKEMAELCFDGVDLSRYENEIAGSDVEAFEDAREVFLVTQKHLNRAKEYYTLEDRASDYVEIVQDHSQLFRHLSAFEPDKERQVKMMRKRVDMLEEVLSELNPRYYMDLCRQLWFELGETYHDLMQMRFMKAQNAPEIPSPQVLRKINTLAEISMKNFNDFLDSLKDRQTAQFPDPLPEEMIGPILVAHFYLGRLYHKYITQSRRILIEKTTKAYHCFKYVVDKCEQVQSARNQVREEFDISRKMMTLLQIRMLEL